LGKKKVNEFFETMNEMNGLIEGFSFN